MIASMVELRTIHNGKYQFGLSWNPSPEQLDTLADLIEHPTTRESGVLEGRGEISIGDVPGFGSVVVKHYARGGLLRHLTQRYYLRVGQVRPRVEYECLDRVRQIGVLAPEPLAYAVEGKVLYRGWLFTREIMNHVSLAHLSQADDNRVDEVMQEVGRQLNILIDNHILHVDLHPGNVLIDEAGKVHLIDFDRARTVCWGRESLRDYYLCRWRRAVIKHLLPDSLSEMLSLHLLTHPHDSDVMRMAREL